jgi:ANTAR domain
MTVSAAGLRQALDQLADLRTSPVTVEEALERVVAAADALGHEDRWPVFAPAAARHGLTTRQAFERLRRQARDQRRPLTEVARGVVSAAEHR